MVMDVWLNKQTINLWPSRVTLPQHLMVSSACRMPSSSLIRVHTVDDLFYFVSFHFVPFWVCSRFLKIAHACLSGVGKGSSKS